jgi:hypothetical protein
MSGFQLTASLATALGWPAGAIVITLLLRRPLGGWITSHPPSKVKAGPLEVEWSKVQAEVESEVGPPPVPSSDGSPESFELSDELGVLAESQPSLAVLGAYKEIERALLVTLADVDDPTKVRAGGPRLARLALQHGRIPPETANAVEAISVLRNLAAHGNPREITADRAREFLAMADAVRFSIEQAGRSRTDA